MGGLGKDCVVKDLREQFNFFGVIANIHIPRVRREFKGFGFVRFKSKNDVEYLLKMNPEIKVGEERCVSLRLEGMATL